MKIYTLTFSCTTNVGAALQEYALYKYLKNKEHKVSVINYYPIVLKNRLSSWSKFSNSSSISDVAKQCILLPIDLYSKYKFYKFSKKYIELTKRCNDISDIEELSQPDVYIAGSDQIWNLQIVGNDKGFFLDLRTDARKISYAGSIGKDDIDKKEQTQISKLIGKLDAVSVREYELQQILINNGIVSTKLVLDPVFLLSKEDYVKIAKKQKYKNYILVYETETNEIFSNLARKIAKKKNLEIIQIYKINNVYKFNKVLPCISPDEFLGLVLNADYILTNSFHGTALSIVLQKQFYVVKLKSLFSRIDTLLKAANLEDRIITENVTNIRFDDFIDYNRVKTELNPLIQESKKYLDKNTIM